MLVAYSLSFFKKPANTVNNGADDINSENVSSASNCCSLSEKPYHPSKDFEFSKTKFGSRNPRSCQHNWFDNYPWLHYDIEKDCVDCFYCMKNVSKLTAEKKKNQHTLRSDLKIGKRHPGVLKITKTVNATKKQQPWQLPSIIYGKTGLV